MAEEAAFFPHVKIQTNMEDAGVCKDAEAGAGEGAGGGKGGAAAKGL